MQLGVFTFNTEYTIAIDRLAVAAEERASSRCGCRSIRTSRCRRTAATRSRVPATGRCRANTGTCPIHSCRSLRSAGSVRGVGAGGSVNRYQLPLRVGAPGPLYADVYPGSVA
jgi:hypothetical protein